MAAHVYDEYYYEHKYVNVDSDAIVLRARLIGLKKYVFFRRLLVADASLQSKMIVEVVNELQEMIDQDQIDLLADYYPCLLRLAYEAPFRTFRDAFLTVLDAIQTKWPTQFNNNQYFRRVSYFIENTELKQLDTGQDTELAQVFQTIFLRNGRVSHIFQLIACHTSYLKSLQASLDTVMLRDGTLPIPWRNYIALMASAESRCYYLAELQKFNFIVNGGDYDWIRGIDFIPEKLFRLHPLFSFLAHRPWLVTPQHIAELLSAEVEDSWSVSELVHAIIVFSVYNSICCIALGLGCAEEEDLAIFSDYNEILENEITDPVYQIQRCKVNERVQARDSGRQSNSTSSSVDTSDLDIAGMERDELQLISRLQSGLEETEMPGQEQNYDAVVDDVLLDDDFEINDEDGELHEMTTMKRRRSGTLWRFCGNIVYHYKDFDVRSSEYQVLHTEDFSWDEHCFSLVRRYFPGDAGQILEDLFNLTSKLTYNYLGNSDRTTDIDTTPYRTAIWYYVHRMFGICHDDYDYRQINYYLNRPTKFFIKKVACTPWKVSKRDFEHFDRTFDISEKVHLTLIVAEARKQANLMYGLRAVMQHMR